MILCCKVSLARFVTYGKQSMDQCSEVSVCLGIGAALETTHFTLNDLVRYTKQEKNNAKKQWNSLTGPVSEYFKKRTYTGFNIFGQRH